MFRAATPRRKPRRTHQRMRAACPMERWGRLAQPREPEQSGRARSGDATRAHGGRGSRRPSQGKPAALALETPRERYRRVYRVVRLCQRELVVAIGGFSNFSDACFSLSLIKV